MKNLKAGDKIVAIDPCKLGSSGPETLTVGKEYEITEADYSGFSITDDTGGIHMFTVANFNKYFKLHETEQSDKFYPFAEEVEMLVWDIDESKALKITVFGRKNGRFLAWSTNDRYFSTHWKNAKPLPKIVTVTMQEIAEWKGVDVEQIKIEG